MRWKFIMHKPENKNVTLNRKQVNSFDTILQQDNEPDSGYQK